MRPTDLIKDNVPDIRFLYDLKDVLYDSSWLKDVHNWEAYYMYRELAKDDEDRLIMKASNLRYDITIVPFQMLNKEFPKTYGHEHTLVANGLSFSELYEVLESEVYYLLQKRNNDEIEDVYVIKAKKGDKILIPPNYGHFIINASGKEIITANWSPNQKSDYAPIKERQGACYYAIRSDNENMKLPDLRVGGSSPGCFIGNGIPPKSRIARPKGMKWLKNPKYSEVPELKIYNAIDFNWLLEKFGINPNEDMYNLVGNLGKLDFLKNPQKYEWSK